MDSAHKSMETIESLIKNSDLKVNAISERLGVTKTTLWHRRKDPSRFEVGEILELSKILDREPEYLFSIILRSSQNKD
jgi:predicted XRE-type DNA-binding protein